MDWDDIRIFLAVAREGSFLGAAKVLKVNQTTVSRRVASFEKKHQVRLFDRLNAGGLTITVQAKGILEHAQEMEKQAQALDRRLVGGDTKLDGKLTITMPDLFSRLLMPHLDKFQREYPNIELEFLTTYLPLNLGGREADIALRVTQAPPEYLIGKCFAHVHHGIYSSHYYHEQHQVLNHHEAQALLRSNEAEKPNWVQDFFPNIRCSTRYATGLSVMLGVENHLGIARLPCFAGDSIEEAGRIPLSLNETPWGVWILSHVDLRSTAKVRVFREFLSDTLTELKPVIEGERSTFFENTHL